MLRLIFIILNYASPVNPPVAPLQALFSVSRPILSWPLRCDDSPCRRQLRDALGSPIFLHLVILLCKHSMLVLNVLIGSRSSCAASLSVSLLTTIAPISSKQVQREREQGCHCCSHRHSRCRCRCRRHCLIGVAVRGVQ